MPFLPCLRPPSLALALLSSWLRCWCDLSLAASGLSCYGVLYWGGQNVPGGVHVIVLSVLGTAGDWEDFLAPGLKTMMMMVTRFRY